MSRSADHQIGRLADWQIGRSRFEIGVKESLKQNTCAAIGEENSKNLNDLKLQNKHKEKMEEENFEAAKELAEKLKDLKVEVKIKTGEGGRTFGSVSTKEISSAVRKQLGFEIDKKKMQLTEPIKSLGTHEVPIRLHAKVTGILRVHVASE